MGPYMYDCEYQIEKGCSKDIIIKIKTLNEEAYTHGSSDACYLAISSDRTAESAVLQVEMTWDSEIQAYTATLSPAQTGTLKGDARYWMSAKLVTSTGTYPALKMSAVYINPDNVTVPT